MSAPVDDGGMFAKQAAVARDMGSPFIADVLEAGLRQLGHAPRTARLIASWPGDRASDALALRFNGALHALARRGATPELSALYRDLDGDFDATIAAVLAQQDHFVADWMTGPPQTNEVGRAAAIMAALSVVAARFGTPFELLELGSSAGLNLNMARFGYDLGGIRFGDLASPLQIAPDWRGPPPPQVRIEIVGARGVDVDPLDITQEAACERLVAFVWADRPERIERLQAAIAVAEAHPPRIDRGDAAAWIQERLAEPQPTGICRTVFHSIVLQYLSADGRAAISAAMATAGQRATDERPLAWIQYEWDPGRSVVALELVTWTGGERRELATCQAHAAWIAWTG